MTPAEISKMRLANQQVINPVFQNEGDLVLKMGAIQAQDYAMAKWAIGTRVKNSTAQSVEAALASGEIIRTHLLRPTWHFVNSRDLRWLLALSAPRIKASTKRRNKELELTGEVINKTNAIITGALSDGKNLTREELVRLLEHAGIATGNNRVYHIFMLAELDGLICSGPEKNKKQTYSLLNERIPADKEISRDEALNNLAKKYFLTRGPATLKDFSWWSGLSVSDAGKALEMISPRLKAETIESKVYWYSPDSIGLQEEKNSVYLLPAFDEFIISYADRSAALSQLHLKKSVSNNGMFWPVIVINGQIAGTWKRTLKNEKLMVETKLFNSFDKKILSLVENKSEALGRFLDKKVETIHRFI